MASHICTKSAWFDVADQLGGSGNELGEKGAVVGAHNGPGTWYPALAVVNPFEVYWMRSKAPSDAEPTHHFEVLELIKVMGGLG